jgi:hypothetical protein
VDLGVYPKVTLRESTWRVILKVDEPGAHSRFRHTVPAGVTAEVPLMMLKLAFDLTVPDTTAHADVDTALFTDLIDRGKDKNKTVWQVWQQLAEDILTGLTDYTWREYLAEWSTNDTQRVRNAAKNTLITQRGWVVTDVHQHEGDGSITKAL